MLFQAYTQLIALEVYIVGKKAKERISKRVLQENKACQIFRKKSIS